MRRNNISKLFSKQCFAKGFLCLFGSIFYAHAGYGMQGCHVKVIDMAVKYCNITKSNKPLRLLLKFCKIKPVHNPYSAISAFGTPYRFDRRVIHHFLQVGSALPVGPGKLIVIHTYGFAYQHMKPPAFQQLYGWL